MKKAVGLLPSPGWLADNHPGLYGAMKREPEAFAHIQQNRKTKTVEEYVQMAEQLEKEHGQLPCATWLVKNAYGGLHNTMWKRPEAFAHIKQSRQRAKRKTLNEQVQIAEQLAKKHGKLPSYKWLAENGHHGLNHAMKNCPEAFKHIQQNRERSTLEEHVRTAEQLARKNGILPNPKWLAENGHHGLNHAMKNCPEAFKHIQQDCKRGKTLEEHVRTAEQLAKKHGILPNPKWLVENGHNGLSQAVRRNPKAFKHIRQGSKKGKTLEEHVRIAEQLAKKHGILPNPKWLIANNHQGLYFALRHQPDAFQHIQQDSKRKTLEEHVRTAEQLVKKYGELPACTWLRNNGHSGLDRAIGKNPKAFKHIKQKRAA